MLFNKTTAKKSATEKLAQVNSEIRRLVAETEAAQKRLAEALEAGDKAERDKERAAIDEMRRDRDELGLVLPSLQVKAEAEEEIRIAEAAAQLAKDIATQCSKRHEAAVAIDSVLAKLGDAYRTLNEVNNSIHALAPKHSQALGTTQIGYSMKRALRHHAPEMVRALNIPAISAGGTGVAPLGDLIKGPDIQEAVAEAAE